jgi:hypothetical protein
MRATRVNVGCSRDLFAGARRVASAVGKQAVTGAVAVHPLGLAGDEQADPSVHGGLAKASWAYPVEHQAFWRTVQAQAGVSRCDEAPAPCRLGTWARTSIWRACSSPAFAVGPGRRDVRIDAPFRASTPGARVGP